MADEDLDADVQQHDSAPAAEEVALPSEATAESAPDGAPTDDAHEDGGAEGGSVESEPDGVVPRKRFNQVYARTKKAESTVQELREEKARLEGQLEATRTAPPVPEPKKEPRLTWTQLEAAIDDGKITRGQAMEYHEETIASKLEAKFDEKIERERVARERGTGVSGELAQYKQAMPEILTLGTAERKKVEREFAYLTSLGYDAKDLRTELLACRAAFGDVQTVKEKRAASQIPTNRGTMQDIPANGKPKPDAKDPLKTITGEQRKYYQRMIDKGQYKGWAEVREELAFVPPR